MNLTDFRAGLELDRQNSASNSRCWLMGVHFDIRECTKEYGEITLGKFGTEEIESAVPGAFSGIELQDRTSMHKRKEQMGKIGGLLEGIGKVG